MESRIPVPTDNIYKFYALFGLLLFIFCCGALIYVIRSSNEVAYTSLPELEGLKQKERLTPAEEARIVLLQRKLDITTSDKTFFTISLGLFAGVAIILMIFGFVRWHRQVQPVADETAKTQLEIAKLQLEKLRRELHPEPPATASNAEVRNI